MTVLAVTDGLSPLDCYAMDVLLDLSRLPRTDRMLDNTTVVTAGPPGATGIGLADGRVVIGGVVLSETASLLTLAAERTGSVRDARGRVPAAFNAMVTSGRSLEPVLQHHAAALRDAVAQARGGMPTLLAPWPGGARWAVALTHDLDLVRWWGLGYAARSLELLRRGEWRRWRRATGAALGAIGGRPVFAAIERLLQVEADLGIASTWFVMAGSPTFRSVLAGDVTYPIGSAQAILERIRDSGHEIGLHGSFATAGSVEVMRDERDRLSQAVEAPVQASRQHFLRMTPLATQRQAASLGFSVDSTIGYYDRPGLRLGVADLVPLADEAGAPLGIAEAPLVWMDRASSKYRGVESPAAWVDEALASARVVESVEGLWVGLWHPNLAAPLGFPDAEPAFADLVARLAARTPWFATVSQVAAWRDRRRRLRVHGFEPDGRPILADPAGVRVDGFLEARAA